MNDTQKNNLLTLTVLGTFGAIIINAMATVTTGKIKTSAGAVNNPGNIKASAIKWQGKITSVGDIYESFMSMFQGYRAMISTVRSHYKRGQNTLNKLFMGDKSGAGYTADPAPVPGNYAKAVAKSLGISPEDDYGRYINNPDTAVTMITAMTRFEQGPKFKINPADITLAFSSLES